MHEHYEKMAIAIRRVFHVSGYPILEAREAEMELAIKEVIDCYDTIQTKPTECHCKKVHKHDWVKEQAEELKMLVKYPNDIDSIADARMALCMGMATKDPDICSKAISHYVSYLMGVMYV